MVRASPASGEAPACWVPHCGRAVPLTEGLAVFYIIIFAVLALLIIFAVIAQRSRKG